MTTDDYLALITSEHAAQPNFLATVAAGIEPLVGLQDTLQGLIAAFDLDTAVGLQLDMVGQWVGISRQLKAPLVGVYFAFDDIASDGWDSGVWQGPFDPSSGLVSLPDDAYRTVLRAKIAANAWDGSIPGAYAVWALVFIGSFILVLQDNQDMSLTIAIAGEPMPIIDKALLISGYIPLKPEGVRIAYYTIVPTPGLLFAWDVNAGTALAGWDAGQWGEILLPA